MRRRAMALGALCAVGVAAFEGTAVAGGEPAFEQRVVTQGLVDPWELTLGPDGWLWLTEKSSGRVLRVNPRNGAKRTVLTVRDNLATQIAPPAQDGLLGMAVEPRAARGGRRHLYVSSSYDVHPSARRVVRRQKITRYTYDADTGRADGPVDLIRGMPASNDHNSGRLVLGPDRKLYYTIGDQGANQFVNSCAKIRSQDLPSARQVRERDWQTYQGKILRLDLDGSVPSDNPRIGGVRSHVWTYGHRNAQGISFAEDGTLYSVEHGPKSDDEVNIISRGKNYGWPFVLGYRDDLNYTWANWSASRRVPCARLEYSDYEIPASVPQQKETDWTPRNFAPPVKTLYTVPAGYDFTRPPCPDDQSFVCWPTIGPSAVEVYTGRGVPGWRNSLLVLSLKYGSLYRLELGANGRPTGGDPVPTWATYNRYRDLVVARDGRTFYVITDNRGIARDRQGRPTQTVDDPGAILRFRYTGSQGR